MDKKPEVARFKAKTSMCISRGWGSKDGHRFVLTLRMDSGVHITLHLTPEQFALAATSFQVDDLEAEVIMCFPEESKS